MHRHARAALAATLLLAGTAGLADVAVAAREDATPTVTASWLVPPSDPVPAGSVAVVEVAVQDPAATGGTLALSLQNATVVRIPDGCRPSSIIGGGTRISGSGHALSCRIGTRPSSTVVVGVRVDDVPAGAVVSGVATFHGVTAPVPDRSVAAAPTPEPAGFRFVSSPDFLNADVGDLADGPGRWSPRRSSNAINAAHRRALDTILDDWKRQRPDEVLVAGDLVDGWWGYADTGDTENFGPIRTPRQRVRAARRAAQTFYPQWLQRFTSRGLDVRPAVGDHELGDNPWTPTKMALQPTYRREWAHYFSESKDGSPRYPDRPRGSVNEMLAHAWRPDPSVQMVTLDVFDPTGGTVRPRLDRPQLHWLAGVLRRASEDAVPWIIVQGHVPILGPVRERGSSGLQYQGGEHSLLWRLFRHYGVDLYLCGEVHDVTAIERDGVTQISHGGLYQFGLTNYLRGDVYPDRIELQLRDFDVHHDDASPRLWESRPAGIPSDISVAGPATTIGTAILRPDGTLSDRSGILRPYRS